MIGGACILFVALLMLAMIVAASGRRKVIFILGQVSPLVRYALAL